MDHSVKHPIKADVTARVEEHIEGKIKKNSKLKPYPNPKSPFEQQTALHC